MSPMKVSKHLIAVLSAFALLMGIPANAQMPDGPDQKPARPNFVVIVADDLGWADLSALAPSPYDTPNLTKMAREGVLFTDFYAYPVCSPSRAQLLSGQNPARFGITDFLPGHWRRFEALETPVVPEALPPATQSLARLLAGAGYRTGYFGQWHLGNPATNGPGAFGFEDVSVTIGGHQEGNYAALPASPRTDDLPLSEFLVERAFDVVGAEDDAPFYVELHPFLVHIPLDAKELASAEAAERIAAFGGSGERSADYGAMVAELDAMVGKMVDGLKASGQLENTVIFFVSDNGGLIRRFDGAGPIITQNLPLSGEKGNVHEGGIRVPLIIYQPGRIDEGRVISLPGSLSDVLPTVLDLAGLSVTFESDGRSLAPLLAGDMPASEERPILIHYPHYHHGTPSTSIRIGKWKLIREWETGAETLFDLTKDVGESQDLATVEPDVRERLSTTMDTLLQAYGAKFPRKNIEYDPARADQWWRRQQMTPELLDSLLASMRPGNTPPE